MKKVLSIVGGLLSASAVIYVLACFISALKLAKEIYPNDDKDI